MVNISVQGNTTITVNGTDEIDLSDSTGTANEIGGGDNTVYNWFTK